MTLLAAATLAGACATMSAGTGTTTSTPQGGMPSPSGGTASGSVPATSAAVPAPPPGPGPWHLVFSDDFPGTALNPAKWATCYPWNDGGCTNRGSGEVEWYLPSQVAVAGGTATLSAVRKDTAGTDGKVYPWLSGMLSTGAPSTNADPRFAFTYGYAEALIKMPAQDLLFPAFWLLPADRPWPPEVDIVEIIGSRTRAWMTLHWKNAAGILQSRHGTYGPVDFSAGYHDFAIAWEPSSLTWYVDGVPRFSITDPSIVPSTPMELLFTLAIGVPRPPPTGVDSGTMSIQHVRVWQK